MLWHPGRGDTVSNRIRDLHDELVEPMLDARDIPWGRGGLSVGVIQLGDEASLRETLRAAVHALASITAEHRRAEAVIVALRDENRMLRRRNAA